LAWRGKNGDTCILEIKTFDIKLKFYVILCVNIVDISRSPENVQLYTLETSENKCPGKKIRPQM